MDTHELKQKIQRLFTEGLVTIVGSGLSCAEGLPGMGALADELKENVPKQIDETELAIWNQIAVQLDEGVGLEAALHYIVISERLEAAIVRISGDFMLRTETHVLSDCLNNGKTLRFAGLLPYLSPAAPKKVEVITTNYDRLIEFSVEASGWGVDTGFVGRLIGHHDPEVSEKTFAKKVVLHRKMPKILYRDRIRLYKPHGSLDWFETPKGAVSSALPMTAKRLLITPGIGKYRQGYYTPFDKHREGANNAVDKATAFLCIGYGFNDEHLQTHLTPRLQAGIPALLLTHGLSKNAAAVVESSANTIALVHAPLGTTIVTQNGSDLIPGVQWWDLEQFIKGVLEP